MEKNIEQKFFSKLYDKLFTLFKFENKYFIDYGLKTKMGRTSNFFGKTLHKEGNK